MASALNEAILKAENQEHTRPKMVTLIKWILWAQNELDKRNIKYPKMNHLATARIEHKWTTIEAVKSSLFVLKTINILALTKWFEDTIRSITFSEVRMKES